eukprot:2790268-Pyramimonas_sp.AAC.1
MSSWLVVVVRAVWRCGALQCCLIASLPPLPCVTRARQALNNWECLLGANILAQTAAWYKAQHLFLGLQRGHFRSQAQDLPTRDMSWEIHVIRCDATNSSSYLGQ